MTDANQPVYTSGSNSIAIELLRTGTPHNQTLSPGVTYLALCGAHPPAEFKINLEQYKFTRYLHFLRYVEGEKTKGISLATEALQEIITKIFEDIPALQAEANASTEWLHLRLIMTPRELAMLPFEFALTPNGFQGAREKAFLINSQRLTTLTREVRQVAPKKYNWPSKPRILFAWAAPAKLKMPPHKEHSDILKAALLPWLFPDKTKPALEPDYEMQITVLEKVTFDALNEAINEAINQKAPYTHVHILAHGTEIPDENGPRFALAFHVGKPIPGNDFAEQDVVDGARLSEALAVVQNNRFYSPAIVTITACDGGNEGTNLSPGGSLAYALHQSGVPYVLASQFPLSMPGSVQLVQDLYPRLLNGEDPRIALYYARQELLNIPNAHDWASIVAYGRFPDDFDDQLEDNKLKIAFDMMKAANGWADHLLQNKIDVGEAHKDVELRLNNAINKLKDLLPDDTIPIKNQARRSEHFGLLGSAYKRLAEHLYRQGSHSKPHDKELLKKSRVCLEEARRYYRKGHNLLLASHWNAVQYLSLTLILNGKLENENDRWCVAHFAAEKELAKAMGQDRIWPLGSLAELYLLKPFIMSTNEFETEKAEAIRKAGECLDELEESDFAFAKESTARQLERYIKWWPIAFPLATSKQLREMAEPLRNCLSVIID